MSKKSRRARAKARAEQQIPGGVPVKKEAMPVSPSQPDRLKRLPDTSTAVAYELRYKHIVPELRSIAVIAGALFIVLIILTFVIG